MIKKKTTVSDEGDSPLTIEEPTSRWAVFLYKLRRKKVIETLAAFIGGGWLILEFVHWILVDHYHFPERSIDVTFITILGALFSTLIWRWFHVTKENPRKIKTELLLVPAVILVTVFLDIQVLTRIDSHAIEKAGTVFPENSIAVLPFEDLSPNEESNNFGDGMTESIISKLSSIQDIKIISKTSVNSYRKTDKDIKSIGSELGVATILEGSVQKEMDNIRITARLVDVGNGFQIWTQVYNRKLTSIFSVQDEIAHAILNALELQLEREESEFLEKHFTENLDAYSLYVQGRSLWLARTPEQIIEAITYFEQAIQEDPNYALAYAGIADSHIALANLGAVSPKEAYPEAREWARKALQIDNTLAEAHTSIAIIKLFHDWDWKGAEQKFKRALELNSSYAMARQAYAYLLAATNRLDAAKSEIQRARGLDPLSLPVRTAEAMVLYLDRQYEASRDLLLEITKTDPGFPMAHLYLGWIYIQEKNFPKALELFQNAYTLSGKNPRIQAWLGYAQALTGKTQEALAALEKLQDYPLNKYVDPSYIALIHMGLNNTDQAFEWLEKGYEERSFWLAWLQVDPVFDSIRQDKRFKDLLKEMKFDPVL